MLSSKGDFKATFLIISPGRKGLVYLKALVNGSNVAILIDTRATNSFMTPECTKRLKVEMDDTTLPVKVNFAQGLCQAAQVASSV